MLTPVSRLYLVDVSSYIFRAFHAIPPLNNKNGLPTNAILGVVNMLLKLVNEERPEAIAIVFDAGGPDVPRRDRGRLQGQPHSNAGGAPAPVAVRAQGGRGVPLALRGDPGRGGRRRDRDAGAELCFAVERCRHRHRRQGPHAARRSSRVALHAERRSRRHARAPPNRPGRRRGSASASRPRRWWR